MFVAFWGTLFQLVVSSFNWNDKVMEDIGERVRQMLRAGGQPDQTEEEDKVAELMKKYPWWTPKAPVEGSKRLGWRRPRVSLRVGAPSFSAKDNTSRGDCNGPRPFPMC